MQPGPTSQGDAWAQIQLALPVRHWSRTEGTRLSPAQPQGPQARREGGLPTPPHLALAPRVCGREFPPPLLSLSLLPLSARCPSRGRPQLPPPASKAHILPPSAGPFAWQEAGGVRLLGNPSSSHQSSSPAPKLWVAVPFPVEQETRLFPRLRASPLPLWLCLGTRTQQGNAPLARKQRDSAIHPQLPAQGADSCHSAPHPLGKRGPIQSEPQRKRIDRRLFIYLCKSEPTLFTR